MKFFRKTSVAILLSVLIVALCCVWGYSRVYDAEMQENGDGTHQSAGESNLNYYLNQLDDRADFFSLETSDAIARQNLILDNRYTAMLVIKTVSHTNGMEIKEFAEQAYETLQLRDRDLFLVLDKNSQSWYLIYGGGLTGYAQLDDSLQSLFTRYLGVSFFTGESDENILHLMDGLDPWLEQHFPVNDSADQSIFPMNGTIKTITIGAILSGIFFTLLANVWWIILIVIVFTFLDRMRLERYLAKHPVGTISPIPFRPILFWHNPGSRWYERMVEDSLYDEEDDFTGDDFTGGDFTGDGFGAGDGQSTNQNEDWQAYQNPGHVGEEPFGHRTDAYRMNGRGLISNLMGLATELMRTAKDILHRFLR